MGQVALESVRDLDQVDATLFLEQMMKALASNWPPYNSCKWKGHYSPTWALVRQELPKFEGLRLLCGERCPTCKAMCINEQGHKSKHDCYHQPSGLTGWHEEHTEELVGDDCAKNVECDRTFSYSTDSTNAERQWHRFRDFATVFPEWVKPQRPLDGCNGDFRKMFFGTYQKQLANHYKVKKCPNIPAYPSKESIIAALRKLTREDP